MAAGPRVGIRFEGEDYVTPTITKVKTGISGLATQAKSSILTGFGIGAGINAFGGLERVVSSSIGYLTDAVRAASDLNESQTKAAVVFGKSAGEIDKWASTASTAFGQSKQQALEAAGTYGNLFQAFGIGREESTKMSKSLVQLAADLASFNNTSVDDALVALRSGLSGETEPLKRYGVALNDARMRQELMAMGVKNLGATLTAEQKATAAYAIIMHDTALAQGDFARTSDGLANTQRTLQAELADVSAEIGNMLLPLVTELAHFAAHELVPALRAMLPVIEDLGKVAIPILVVALGSKLVGALKAVGVAAGGTLGPLGAVVGLGLALGDAGKKGADGAAEATIAMRYGADAAKVFSDALEAAGGDGQKAMDALNAYLKQEFVPQFVNTGKVAAMELAASGRDMTQAAYQAITNPIVTSIQDARNKANEIAGKIPKGMGDAMLAAQKDLKDSIKTLVAFMDEALTPAQEKAAARAFLASKAYADGMASGTPAVVAKTKELANAALVVLNGAVADGTAAAGGKAVAKAWQDALNASLNSGVAITASYVAKYERLLGGSLPEEGPLKGHTAAHGGASIAQDWLSGINKGLGGGTLNLPTLPTGGSGATGLTTTSSVPGGVRDIHIHIDQGAYIDGPSLDLLTHKIATRLRFAPGT